MVSQATTTTEASHKIPQLLPTTISFRSKKLPLNDMAEWKLREYGAVLETAYT